MNHIVWKKIFYKSNFTANFGMERAMNADWSITFVAVRNCTTVSMAKLVNQVFTSNIRQLIVRHFENIPCMSPHHQTKQRFLVYILC